MKDLSMAEKEIRVHCTFLCYVIHSHQPAHSRRCLLLSRSDSSSLLCGLMYSSMYE
jgi:hypothetical protein